MGKKLLTIALLGLFIFAVPPSSAQNGDLKTAHTLFTNGKFAEAADLFAKAIGGPAKNNPLAHYYYATCLNHLGKTHQANSEYRMTLTLNPPATIANYCRQALGQRTKTPSGTSESSNSSPGQPPSSSAPVSTSSRAIDPADKALLEIHRHTQDTDAISSIVLAALSAIPRKIKDEVKDGGCKILICPTILEANPHLANNKAAGYVHGGGYDNCPGMFYSGTKILYIAERVSWKSSPPEQNRGAASTTLHEFGHAYDFVKGKLSTGGEFASAYREDFGRLTNSQRTEWQYYCQDDGGERGRSECFAELFAISHGTGAGITRGTTGLVNVFPKTFSYMKQLSLM